MTQVLMTPGEVLVLHQLEALGAMTALELAEETRLTKQWVRACLRNLHAAGKVYIIGWEQHGDAGRYRTKVWAAGYMQDTPRPKPRPGRDRTADWRDRTAPSLANVWRAVDKERV